MASGAESGGLRPERVVPGGLVDHFLKEQVDKRDGPATAVWLKDDVLIHEVDAWALRNANVALRAAAAALPLRVVPRARWQRLRKDADTNGTPGLVRGVSLDVAAYVKTSEPEWVNIRSDGFASDEPWDDALRDTFLATIGHECGHLWDNQGLTKEEIAAEPAERCPHIEKACDLVRDTLLPRLRAAVAEAEATWGLAPSDEDQAS